MALFKKEPQKQLLPADLLNDLESDDRTNLQIERMAKNTPDAPLVTSLGMFDINQQQFNQHQSFVAQQRNASMRRINDDINRGLAGW